MPQVSVIVPVYNAEAYLPKCIDSILRQLFEDFELILVDDGSLDNCGLICDEYATKDSRIIVKHIPNSGASAARNRGIELASGKYLAFCDSDDYVSPYWLSRMLHFSAKGVLTIGASSSNAESLGQRIENGLIPGKAYPRSDYYRFKLAGIAGYLWNALYERAIVERYSLRLREKHADGDYNEDLLFALNYIRYIDCIIFTGHSDYCYVTRENSLSRGNNKYYFAKYAEKYRLWSEFLKQNYQDPNELIRNLCTETLYHFVTALRMSPSFDQIRSIVLSSELQTCLGCADTKRENQTEIAILRRKNPYLAFVFYQLVKLREKQI